MKEKTFVKDSTVRNKRTGKNRKIVAVKKVNGEDVYFWSRGVYQGQCSKRALDRWASGKDN